MGPGSRPGRRVERSLPSLTQDDSWRDQCLSLPGRLEEEAISLAVVPANAGTHSHRCQWLRTSFRTASVNCYRHGVWVPAQGRDDVLRGQSLPSRGLTRVEISA